MARKKIAEMLDDVVNSGPDRRFTEREIAQARAELRAVRSVVRAAEYEQSEHIHGCVCALCRALCRALARLERLGAAYREGGR